MKPLLSVRKLSKSFGTLPVIRQVSFDVQPGEVVGLAGSIGSGKSVLAMMVAGMYQPDEGSVIFDGQELIWPFSAQSHDIGIIYQKPILNDQYDVVSNIFLGNEIGWPTNGGWFKIINESKMDSEARRILAQLGVKLKSTREKVSNLSGMQRQLISIARVLTYQLKLVIVDEPNVLLTYPYQQRLLDLIQTWRENGVGVLFSSTDLDDLFAVTDRIVVLKQGRIAADLRTDETTREVVSSILLGINESLSPSIHAVWDFDSYDRIRDSRGKLRQYQMLLGNDLASEPTLSRQLAEQMAEQVQALDQANVILIEGQRRLLTEREQERKHVAREIHDQVIQDLLSINYELEGMETEQEITPALASDLAVVREGIRELVVNLRRICGDLRPPTIDSLGVGAALKSYTRDWSQRTSIHVDMQLDENLGRLPEATELSVFRIVQEGLNNVWRHAKASKVQIVLEHTTPRMLMMSIQDNGRGLARDFDINGLSEKGHYGLIGISERVALLGGRFRLQDIPSGGAQLVVEIPHPRIDTIQETLL
ncbi:MAG: ATP-binding cassette domain-containing protein [Anaerolineaceae bacterium]|jgi:signal transduction histidine kinase|nr:ATP-binding cassette domain-containing protein [Anaerolineaceae bacterium]